MPQENEHGLVLDASLTLAWFFKDEKTETTDRLLKLIEEDCVINVPAIWYWEITNILLNAQKRKGMANADVEQFIDDLRDFDVIADPVFPDVIFGKVRMLAELNSLTVYDAAYLELALRLGIPLATLDKDLRAAAKKAGIKLLPEKL